MEMKVYCKKAFTFLLCLLVMLPVLPNLKAQAHTEPNDLMAPIYCLVTYSRHIPQSRVLAKVKIDNDSNIYNYTRATCPCGAEVYYNGYPQGYNGSVDNYFYTYYDSYIDYFSGYTVLKVHSVSYSSSPNLVDWYLDRDWNYTKMQLVENIK